MMERIKLSELAQRLAAQTELADDQTPSKAPGIMLYGWKNKRRFSQSYRNALKHRDWMYITEVMDLSAYVGVDLTKK
jgi:hypothetical protein